MAVALTPNDAEGDDAKTAIKMLAGKTHRLKSFRGDGAYDAFELLNPSRRSERKLSWG